MNYIFRKATQSDVAEAFLLYENRIQWMNERGYCQWNKTNYLSVYPMTYFNEQVTLGNFYVMENTATDKIYGSVVLLENDERWSEKLSGDAYYIHNLVTKLSEKEIGKRILLQIENLAAENKKKFLRLDCAADNAFLNSYYEAIGYSAVGIFSEGPYNGIKREKRIS